MNFCRKTGLLLMILLSGVGCKKSNTCSIPSVLVDFTIYTTDPTYFKLNAIGGWVYVTGGSKGIIVYHQSVDQYVAFDRNCTYNPTASNAVVYVDTTTNITSTCTACSSKFSIYDGSLLKGPAACSLKQYYTYLNGSALRVYSQ